MKKVILSLLFFLTFLGAQALAQSTAHNSKLPVEITADKLEVLKQNQKAIFSGAVVAKQGNITIKADKMLVYYSMDEKKGSKDNSRVSKVETNGNVILSTPTETASSNTGVFDIEQNIIRLNGNVVLTSGKNVVKGEQLVYNLTTGQSQIVSSDQKSGTKKERVRGVFTPN